MLMSLAHISTHSPQEGTVTVVKRDSLNMSLFLFVSFFVLVVLGFVCFEIRFFCIALAVLRLTM